MPPHPLPLGPDATIFATATAPGRAGVAVIRISGPAATTAYAAFGVPRPAPRQAVHARLRHPDSREWVDDALILHFPAPRSYTGEDVVELHLHGSRAVLREVTEILSALPGFRLAEPGEFTRRAYLNGKMDLMAAEGVMDLIDAETSMQKRQAARQMHGEVQDFYTALRVEIVESMALLEAYIDFPDEEIPESVLSEMQRSVTAATTRIRGFLADNQRGQKIRDGIHIAIIGAPNAGKSTLLNWLARRDAAITSPTPGTTRDVVEVALDIGGYPVMLADTAGLRESDDAIEAEGIRRARARAADADLVLALFDAAALPGLDAETLNSLPPRGGELGRGGDILEHACVIPLISRSDLASSPLPALVSGVSALPISVTTGAGCDALMMEISNRVSLLFSTSEPPIITQARHRNALELALAALERVFSEPALELQCEHLRRAAMEIGKITGKIIPDELLGVIFGKFCIGK